jgi:signal transduction histidine kinase
VRLLEIALVVLGGPVVLGLLAARYVRRPLRQFNEAIASLGQNNYTVELHQTGIREFDEVFTKFNNLTKQLQREEKLRKDLVSDTSHELNTPLTAMIGQLTAIQEGKHSISPKRVAILKEQAERLAELVHQLDAYTKARMPHTDTSEDLRVTQFCDQILAEFALELKQKNIQVRLDSADTLVIRADRGALQQILVNLIQNTLRYSEASELVISATPQRLTFSDNGKGVPAENLPYLFERFYRVETSRNRKSGGLGLGLAIVKELTGQQGWTIHAQAAHPGLTFALTF